MMNAFFKSNHISSKLLVCSSACLLVCYKLLRKVFLKFVQVVLMGAHLACLLQFLLILRLGYRRNLHAVLKGGDAADYDLVAYLQS